MPLRGHGSELIRIESSAGPQIVTSWHQAFSNITDDIFSIAWFPDNDDELLYATEHQVLMCDTRQPNYNRKPIVDLGQRMNQEHIQSLKFDPFNSKRFAAQTSQQILIFDLRFSGQAANRIRHQIKSDDW